MPSTATTTPPPHGTRASPRQNVEIHAALSAGIVAIVDGVVTFRDGVSDATIAAEIGVPVSSVQSMRRDMFGAIKRPAASRARDEDDLRKVVFDLAARVAFLEAALGVDPEAAGPKETAR